jgi:hypothetical protein
LCKCKYLHLYCCCVYVYFYIYMALCKCLYYIFLMIIPSCKSILISCECISKLNVFLIMDHFDWPFTKNHDTLIFPKHYHFLPMWDYGGVIPRNILNAHFASPHCLSSTFMNSINTSTFISTTYCSFKKNVGTYCDSY